MYQLNNKGFTFIEVLVALVIFALGALVFAHMQILNIRGSSFGKNAVTATVVAQKQIEALKSTAFNAIVSQTTGVTDQNMAVTWTVTTFGTAPTRYKTILLTVTWTGNSLSFNTIVSEI